MCQAHQSQENSLQKVLETIAAVRAARAKSRTRIPLHELAKRFSVPETNLCRWLHLEDRYKGAAAKVRQQSFKGIKQRRLAAKYKHELSRSGEFGETLTVLESQLRDQLLEDRRKGS